MPPRRNTVCNEPGCPEDAHGGKCPTHKAQAQRQASRQRRADGRGADHYGTTEWMRTKRAFIAAHPTCEDCPAPSVDADHVPPRRILVAAGIHNPDADQWLHPRCHACHARRTQLVDIPLLRRLEAGADPAELAEEAMNTLG